jgi:hypothetical protein
MRMHVLGCHSAALTTDTCLSHVLRCVRGTNKTNKHGSMVISLRSSFHAHHGDANNPSITYQCLLLSRGTQTNPACGAQMDRARFDVSTSCLLHLHAALGGPQRPRRGLCLACCHPGVQSYTHCALHYTSCSPTQPSQTNQRGKSGHAQVSCLALRCAAEAGVSMWCGVTQPRILV